MATRPARTQPGFTLLEALIALAVISIGVCIAVPAYVGAMAATHSSMTRAALYDSLIAALNHSIITQTNVVACSSNDGVDCSGNVDWSGGWIVFADLDRNRIHGPHETLLRHQRALDRHVHLRSTVGRTRIVFQPHGGVNAGSNVTFTLCDQRGAAKATTVVLANSGRLRQGVPSAAVALACVRNI